jgi:hypothetical protein
MEPRPVPLLNPYLYRGVDQETLQAPFIGQAKSVNLPSDSVGREVRNGTNTCRIEQPWHFRADMLVVAR